MVILHHCSSLSDQIHQTPPDLFRKQNQTAEIHCSHTIDNYDRILWYKQSVDGRHVYFNEKEYEEGFQKDFIFTGDLSKDEAKNITLTISNLKTSEHSAVYYCAASYAQWQQMPSASYNNLHPSV
uniref:Ig-like domain-containing protein n=1 Tax=Gouania willdenowi TaxID=441366 RepID=A0A8C5DIG3_GOUWI